MIFLSFTVTNIDAMQDPAALFRVPVRIEAAAGNHVILSRLGVDTDFSIVYLLRRTADQHSKRQLKITS
jgi:hypothetical protein